ncbi:MAG: 4-hydroxy-tetrahydrodipicolinate synthase [Bdellovibrionales bacterium]
MKNLTGVITALITPFKNGEVDFESLNSLIRAQVDQGIKALVINGTTAESPTLDWSEVEKIFNQVRQLFPDLVLILGTGSNSTKKAVELTRKAKDLGADAALSVVPYYNKPTQEGMEAHFTEIAKSADIPILLYNVPGRTVASLNLETVIKLSKIKNIVGIKEASGDPVLCKNIKESTENFVVLSGDDDTYLQSALLGADGVISVISHILPKQFIDWTGRAVSGDESILTEYKKAASLCDLLFKEPNPTPTKACLKMMGLISSDELRLPLMSCSEALANELSKELKSLEVIK